MSKCKLCGGHLQPVLDTLSYVHHQTQCWLEVTTLLIPGQNDSDQEIGALAKWLAQELGPEVPLHLSAFHPDWKMTALPPPTNCKRVWLPSENAVAPPAA